MLVGIAVEHKFNSMLSDSRSANLEEQAIKMLEQF